MFYQSVREGVGAPTTPSGPVGINFTLPEGYDPKAEAARFIASRQGQTVSPDYLGIPDYEIKGGGATSRVQSPVGPWATETMSPSISPEGDRARFLDEFVKQKMARDIAWTQAEQQRRAAEIDPRERMMAELELERKKAELTGAEAGARTAEAENIRARTEILRDPTAIAAKQGTATAEELISYRERVLAQARSEIDPTSVATLAASMVAKKLARNLEEAQRMATDALIQAHYDGILADDPQLRQILARTGMMPGGTAMGLPGTT